MNAQTPFSFRSAWDDAPGPFQGGEMDFKKR